MPATKYCAKVMSGAISWPPNTDPKITSSTTGKAKFYTAELRSRKNCLSSMATRRRPMASMPGRRPRRGSRRAHSLSPPSAYRSPWSMDR